MKKLKSRDYFYFHNFNSMLRERAYYKLSSVEEIILFG